MDTLLTVISVVAVAATIGGLTNYLAIKMLFHPRKPLYIGKWKVPFTPGLIPKRKDEIAGSLGRIVAEYLVTSEGVAQVLMQSSLRNKAADVMQRWVEDRLDSGDTIADLAARLVGDTRWQTWVDHDESYIRSWTKQGIAWLWVKKDAGAVKLSSLLPGWDEAAKRYWVDRAADYLLDAVSQELQSDNGTRVLRRLIDSFLERAGGFMGALAGIFMDEDKLLVRVRHAALEQLRQPYVRQAVTGFLMAKVDDIEQKSLRELLEAISGEDTLGWLQQKADNILSRERWQDRLYNMQLSELVGEHRAALIGALPSAADWLLERAVKHVHQAVAAIDLPKMVESQVAGFPVERVEQIVLSVSGREFRAITWLGAFLGGFIGLLQSLFFLL